MILDPKKVRAGAWRALFLQAAWNFDRMQNLGFAFCMEPGLRQLYPDPKARAAALKRHAEIFNTHPFMAPYIVGAVLRSEAEFAGKQDEGMQAQGIKLAMAPALAALGDNFYWGTLKPAAGFLGAAWLWLAPAPWHLAAPLVLLAAFNLPSIILRLGATSKGWDLGTGVALYVARLRMPAAAEGIRLGVLVLVGGLIGALHRVRHPGSGQGVPLQDNLLFLGAGLGLLLLLRLGVRPAWLLALCVVSSLMLALAIP